MIEILLQLIDKPHWCLFFLLGRMFGVRSENVNLIDVAGFVFFGGKGVQVLNYCNLDSLIFYGLIFQRWSDLKVAEEGVYPLLGNRLVKYYCIWARYLCFLSRKMDPWIQSFGCKWSSKKKWKLTWTFSVGGWYFLSWCVLSRKSLPLQACKNSHLFLPQ